MHDRVIFLSEPLLSTEFVQHHLVVPLAARLAAWFSVGIAAPALAADVRAELATVGVDAIDGGAWFPPPRSPRDEAPSYTLAWSREAMAGLNSRLLERVLRGQDGFRVNISMTNAAQSDLWYIQSRPLPDALRSMAPAFRPGLRVAIRAGQPLVEMLDRRLCRRAAARARVRYSSSRHVAELYGRAGFAVDGVIPSFVYPDSWTPSTARPSRDYVLGYLGKETDTEALGELSALGFPVKVFGSKSAGWIDDLPRTTGPTRVERLGRVSHEQLVNLYTNALFTAFPFTEESFGLVPIESMACGTPVLTYAMQGPAETVADRETGWLARDRSDLVSIAREVVRTGLPAGMPAACIARAGRFRLGSVAEAWRAMLRSRLDRGPSARG
ncbi:MAG TPA: glycosyltransferase [Thermoplasmata archaeon]|nr:glycosyltransferase [Thermoplasmata archaeon]